MIRKQWVRITYVTFSSGTSTRASPAKRDHSGIKDSSNSQYKRRRISEFISETEATMWGESSEPQANGMREGTPLLPHRCSGTGIRTPIWRTKTSRPAIRRSRNISVRPVYQLFRHLAIRKAATQPNCLAADQRDHVAPKTS